jgi:hypothetical protein
LGGVYVSLSSLCHHRLGWWGHCFFLLGQLEAPARGASVGPDIFICPGWEMRTPRHCNIGRNYLDRQQNGYVMINGNPTLATLQGILYKGTPTNN